MSETITLNYNSKNDNFFITQDNKIILKRIGMYCDCSGSTISNLILKLMSNKYTVKLELFDNLIEYYREEGKYV